MRIIIKAAAVVSLLATADGLATTATKAPIWLTMPAVSSEAALAAAAPLQMLPPRRVVDTSFDGSGRPTPGAACRMRCFYSSRTRSQKRRHACRLVPMSRLLTNFTVNTVLDFAVANEGTRWRDEDSTAR